MILHRKFGLRRLEGLCAVAAVLMAGCQQSATTTDEARDKAPRPVSVFSLTKSTPASSYSASGIAKSWKTEDIGFEVAGRVLWVWEPGKDIDGRIIDPDGKLVQPGTPLAMIEPGQYQIAVEENAIARDGDETFIHIVTNAKLRETMPEVVKVRRQRITENDLRIPFLGNWVFRSVSFVSDDNSPMEVDYDLM